MVLYKCKEKNRLPSQGGREENVSWQLRLNGNNVKKPPALENTPGGTGCTGINPVECRLEKHSTLTDIK